MHNLSQSSWVPNQGPQSTLKHFCVHVYVWRGEARLEKSIGKSSWRLSMRLTKKEEVPPSPLPLIIQADDAGINCLYLHYR